FYSKYKCKEVLVVFSAIGIIILNILTETTLRCSVIVAILLLIIIVEFMIYNNGREDSVVDWIRSLDVVVRCCIFTSILVIMFNLTASLFVSGDPYSEASFSMTFLSGIGALLIIVSYLCFIYIFIRFLYYLLFGNNN